MITQSAHTEPSPRFGPKLSNYGFCAPALLGNNTLLLFVNSFIHCVQHPQIDIMRSIHPPAFTFTLTFTFTEHSSLLESMW